MASYIEEKKDCKCTWKISTPIPPYITKCIDCGAWYFTDIKLNQFQLFDGLLKTEK